MGKCGFAGKLVAGSKVARENLGFDVAAFNSVTVSGTKQSLRR